jgi:hypothetical protein
MTTKAQEKETDTEQEINQAEKTELNEGQEQAQKTEDQITITQSDLDRKINEAIFKNQKKMEKEYEDKLLAEQGEYQKLAENYKAELESIKAEKEKEAFQNQVLKKTNEAGLTDYSDILMKLPDMESVESAIKSISEKINSSVKSEIEKKISTPEPPESNEVKSISTTPLDKQAKLNRALGV